MKRITVSLDDDTYEIVRRHAFKLRSSVSKYISQMAANSTASEPEEISNTPKVMVDGKEHAAPITSKEEEKPWTQITQCEFRACRKDAIGNFKIVTYSTDTGDQSQTQNLCKLHKHLAGKEGTVTEV